MRIPASARTPPPSSRRNNSGMAAPLQPPRARWGEAAHHIAGECERLFCETLRAVFLGWGDGARRYSLAMGVHDDHDDDDDNDDSERGDDDGAGASGGSVWRAAMTRHVDRAGDGESPLPTPPAEGHLPSSVAHADRPIGCWIEVWDYVGGGRFRGFTAQDQPRGGDKTLFVFFDGSHAGRDLKQG